MTRNAWIDLATELEQTMPDPADVSLRERRRQMWDRLTEIDEYLHQGGPEPRADWHLTVPDATDEEKAALRAKAIAWFADEMQAMGRDLAEMDAVEPGDDDDDTED